MGRQFREAEQARPGLAEGGAAPPGIGPLKGRASFRTRSGRPPLSLTPPDARELHDERGTSARLALHANAAAVPDHDPAHEVEPQAEDAA